VLRLGDQRAEAAVQVEEVRGPGHRPAHQQPGHRADVLGQHPLGVLDGGGVDAG